MQPLEPIKNRFTAGNARLHLGDHGAHYGENSAGMEAFSRTLWGLVPLWSQGGGTPLLVKAWPNTSLLHPVTRIPTIRFHLEPGTHRLVTVVTGSESRALNGMDAAYTKEGR